MYDIIIPGEVAHSDISTPCKYFYGELRGLAQRDGVIYATNAYLEKHCDLSEKQIQRNLRCLELYGFIHIETDGKRRKIYLSTNTPTKMSGIPDINGDQNKKTKDNKDYINILSTGARVCEVLGLPYIRALYTRLLAQREVTLIALSNCVDMDTANAIVSAYYTLPAYAIAYWQVFDAGKLQYVATTIKRKRIQKVREYVLRSFEVPPEWQTVERINYVESELAEIV